MIYFSYGSSKYTVRISIPTWPLKSASLEPEYIQILTPSPPSM